MRDKRDPGSVDMFPGTKRGRGRPPTGNAMTGAERAAKYRERRASETSEAIADLQREVRRLKRQVKTAAVNKRDVTKKTK